MSNIKKLKHVDHGGGSQKKKLTFTTYIRYYNRVVIYFTKWVVLYFTHTFLEMCPISAPVKIFSF